MNHKDINKRKKYIAGGAAAMAVAIASCGVGMCGNNDVKLNESEVYMTDNTSGADTQLLATTTDANLADTLAADINVGEKDVYKDETVYVFADANGNTNSILVNEKLKNADGAATLTDKTNLKDIVNVKGDETFTQNGETITWDANGNDICYQGTSDKELPVDVKVTYYLDGREITSEQLAGQSGKVKIRFDYENQAYVKKSIDGKEENINVPFIAVSGMMLGDNFKNITVENGKVVTEGDTNIVVGYATPGLQDSLDIDDTELAEDITFPEYFEMTADVTDFSMDVTITILMNGSAVNLAGDIDMSSLDDMVESLTDASTQLVDGSGELSDGVNTLLSKMGEFSTGVSDLQSGLNALANGSGDLATGISTINTSAQSISAGISGLNTALNTTMTDEEKQSTAATAAAQAQAAVTQSPELQAQVQSMVDEKIKAMSASIISGMTENGAGVIGTQVADACEETAITVAGQTAGAAAVAGVEGAKSEISAQINAVQANGYSLVTGAQALADGTNTLAAGVPTLSDGVSKLITGVNKLVGGTEQLTDGVNELADGANALSDGMSQFNEQAIDKLVNAYDGDLKKLADRIQAVLEAASEYDTYTLLNDGDAGTTKFIIKTEGIKAE